MRIFLLLFTLMLGACGFHLRGHGESALIPFDTLYLDAANPNTPFIDELRRGLLASKVTLVDKADKADVVLNIVFEVPEKQILSLGGGGRVNEFQLRFRVSLRAYDQEQRDWIMPGELVQRRDYSYDDTQILAKESEEALLYQSMRSDMVQQILRRLSLAKPQAQQ